MYASHARHHRPQPTHLLSETVDLDGRNLKSNRTSRSTRRQGQHRSTNCYLRRCGIQNSNGGMAWHCMAACQEAFTLPGSLQIQKRFLTEMYRLPSSHSCLTPWVEKLVGKGWAEMSTLLYHYCNAQSNRHCF